ncbi:MAG: SIR2 family protein [Alteromonadaceae bacterium]|jgi:hypothetical protein
MDINEFVSEYKNHPVLFIGTGLSLRYLQNSYTWDGLLEKIAYELSGNEEFYLDIKAECQIDGFFKFDKIAEVLESKFNHMLTQDRDGKFKSVNDVFYEKMKEGIRLSRFKIYICNLLAELDYRDEMRDELNEFRKTRKNIGSVITTNYDLLIEDTFKFNSLVGNNILLSNPYGSVYKIHGCVDDASKIIISEQDYKEFDSKYELIRAQLLSLFIHNPIIFLGYNVGDDNIKSLLKTIFSYVESNSPEAKKIKSNFLLVEYSKDSSSTEISTHDIDIEGFSTIGINKISTDNFTAIYKAISGLMLPVSAMDIRRVQSVWKKISSGGEIKVKISENIDELANDQMVIAVGADKHISYEYQPLSEMMKNYFLIVEEANSQLIELLNKQTIQSGQFCPIYAFSLICPNLERVELLKEQQKNKIESITAKANAFSKVGHSSIEDIFNDEKISNYRKLEALIYSVMNDKIELDIIKQYLQETNFPIELDYKKLLCAYDYKKYNEMVNI